MGNIHHILRLPENHPTKYSPGASVRGWRDVFPHAMVVGLDVDRDALVQGPRLKSYLCNSMNSTRVHEILEGSSYDLIVDDGLHIPVAQQATLRNLWRYLRTGGWYI